MTTTIKVTTHNWPVSVQSDSRHEFNEPSRRGHGYSSSTVFVPKNSEFTTHVAQGGTVTFEELHPDATSLDDHYERVSAAAGSASNGRGLGMLSGGAMTIGERQVSNGKNDEADSDGLNLTAG